MKNDVIRPNILGIKIISNISPEMAQKTRIKITSQKFRFNNCRL